MPDLIDPQKLISVAEAAKRYGYNAKYLSRVASEGKFKAWFVGGSWITTLDLIETYIENAPPPGRRRKSTQQKHK